MAKKPAAPVDVPHIYASRLEKLSPEDLATVRAFITSPVWTKFLRVLACQKPSPNVRCGGSSDRDAFSDARTNARLGEIRGWELYEHAIFLALFPPAEIRKAPEENYPDAGLLRIDPVPGTPRK